MDLVDEVYQVAQNTNTNRLCTTKCKGILHIQPDIHLVPICGLPGMHVADKRTRKKFIVNNFHYSVSLPPRYATYISCVCTDTHTHKHKERMTEGDKLYLTHRNRIRATFSNAELGSSPRFLAIVMILHIYYNNIVQKTLY